MKTLSREAKSIVDRARSTERLGEGDRSRLKQRVMTRVAAGAIAGTAIVTLAKGSAAAVKPAALGASVGATPLGVASLGVASVGAPSLGVTSLGVMALPIKVLFSVLLVGGAIGSSILLTRSDRASIPAAPSAPTVVSQTDPPQRASASSATNAPSPEDINRPSVLSAPPERTAKPQSSSVPVDSLKEETALLTQARAALSQNRPDDALAILEEHASRFPKGQLAQERHALRALASCALGRFDEGRREADSLVKMAPDSPLTARILRACHSE